MNAQSQPHFDPHGVSADRSQDAEPRRSQAEPAAAQGEASGEQPPEVAATDQSFADAADNSSGPAGETRDEALERMAHEVEQARQRVLMAQAELENFRKRTRKDYEEQVRFAALPLVEDLLQVRDNLVRAIDAAEASGGSIEGLKAGVEMVTKQFDDALAKHGITPISAVGEPFDPNFHQAISQTPSPEHAEGVVAIEATTGFQMHQRVVRPSQVVVSTGKPAT